MKRYIMIISLVLLASIASGQFAGGYGTLSNPYRISTPEHLNNVRGYIGSGYSNTYFILVNDIDLTTYLSVGNSGYNSGSYWYPIGASTGSFEGQFDGNNKTISGLKIERNTNGVGLFGYIGVQGAVRNLTVEIDPEASIIGNWYVGALVGQNKGEVNNCHVTGTVNCVESSAGGLVGRNEGIIEESDATCTVSASGDAGGLVGYNKGTINHCHATGSVTISSQQNAGGLVGHNYNGTIHSCYASGAVSSSCEYGQVGGFVGLNYYGEIYDSYALGSATGDRTVGGFIGNHWMGTVQNSFSRGNVTRRFGSYSDFGGFIGKNYQGEALNCYSTGYVKAGTSYLNKGFCGAVTTGGNYSMSGNFWDTQTSKASSTAGSATGKTTAEMTTIAFNSPNIYTQAGWDFKGETLNGEYDIWNIGPGINDAYPYFTWQYQNTPSIINAINATQSITPETPDPEPIDFTGTGVTIDFSGISGATGSNDITVSKFNDPPSNLDGLIGSEINIFGSSFLFTNITGFSFTSSLQFLVDELTGVNNAQFAGFENGTQTDIKLWKRSEYGQGEFSNMGYLLYNKGEDNMNLTADDFLYIVGISEFSEFAFSSNVDHQVPIILQFFRGTDQNGTILLSWRTASETENAAFRIYRDDEMIGEIEGAGTTTEPQAYSWRDNYVIPGRTYSYVLADVDLQGKEKKHNEVKVEIEVEPDIDKDFNIGAAYPNPFNPVTVVPLNLAKDAAVRAVLYDIRGHAVRELLNGDFSAGFTCAEDRRRGPEHGDLFCADRRE